VRTFNKKGQKQRQSRPNQAREWKEREKTSLMVPSDFIEPTRDVRSCEQKINNKKSRGKALWKKWANNAWVRGEGLINVQIVLASNMIKRTQRLHWNEAFNKATWHKLIGWIIFYRMGIRVTLDPMQ
ncbi:hypothetical protein Tco_1053079, partial [Tanacetum coccineum]